MNKLLIALILALVVGVVTERLAAGRKYMLRYAHSGQHRTQSDFWGRVGVLAWGA